MPIKNPKENGNFRDVIETFARTKTSPVEVFSDFVRMSACALACQTREEEYLEVAKKYDSDELKEFSKALAWFVNESEGKPFSDLLGGYYEDIASKSARDTRGEFFTPEHISEFMARLCINVEKVIEDNMPVRIYEPTCGSGGIILQSAKQLAPPFTGKEKSYVDLLRFTAQDISPLACDMTYLNTTLWGIPTRVVLGNTLTNEVRRIWANVHWYRVGEHFHEWFRDLIGTGEPSEKDSKGSDFPDEPTDQMQWDF